MLPSAQLIIIELGCLDICNRNMRKFVVKYNQMECSCKLTSCFVNKMYYFGLLAFRLSWVANGTLTFQFHFFTEKINAVKKFLKWETTLWSQSA